MFFQLNPYSIKKTFSCSRTENLRRISSYSDSDNLLDGIYIYASYSRNSNELISRYSISLSGKRYSYSSSASKTKYRRY